MIVKSNCMRVPLVQGLVDLRSTASKIWFMSFRFELKLIFVVQSSEAFWGDMSDHATESKWISPVFGL